MSVLRFRANSIQEALQLVRDNLGPDASVVSTRQVRAGFFSRSLVEVQASRDLVVPSRFQNSSNFYGPAFHQGSIHRDAQLQDHDDAQQSPLSPIPPGTANDQMSENSQNETGERDRNTPRKGSQEFAQKFSRTTQLYEAVANNFPDFATPAMTQVLSELKEAGVPEQLASDLLLDACRQCSDAYLNDSWLIRGQIVEMTARRLAVASSMPSDSSEQRIVAFLGPPESGKTTLLCKVAHQASIENQVEIGIVVVDNWKSSVTDSLVHLADRISAEVEAVSSPEQLAKAMQRLRECDLVFIDTAGCLPQDPSQMRRLHEILQIAQPDEIHLVLGADSELSDMELAIDKFASLGSTWLDISRLDRARKTGRLLAKLFACQIPVANLSHGADVSSDLIQPNRRYAASVLLGQKSFGPIPSE